MFVLVERDCVSENVSRETSYMLYCATLRDCHSFGYNIPWNQDSYSQ